jgi:hypothetical protein
LTRNAAPFTPAGGLGYRYNNVLDRLIIGGFMTGINGISGLTSDFMYAIYGFTNTPNALQASDSIETVAGFTHPAIGPLQLTAVPLPAAFYMFGTAIAGLFGVGWRRRMAST